MRIIGGRAGGLRLHPPTHLPVRPTTDLAKEALFNILNNRLDFQGLCCLDLFAGTGNVAFELASRGAKQVTAVDLHGKCVQYIKQTSQQISLQEVHAKKADVFRFIQSTSETFDLIFADPPYDLNELPDLANRILEEQLLKPDGWLIVEHPTSRKLKVHPNLTETRSYGSCSFSFYRSFPIPSNEEA